MSEFSIFTTSEDLKPEHLGFVPTEVGQQCAPGRRPHYPPHIPRVAVPYDERNEPQYSRKWDEAELSNLLVARSGFVLLGEPTAGKSRALYCVVKRLVGYCVIKPRHHVLPSIEALSLCKRFPVVLLLDDLNDFVGADVDLLELANRLDHLGIAWMVAAGCRDGTELAAVKEAVGTSLRKFYEQIPYKCALRRANDDDKKVLVRQLNPNKDVAGLDVRAFPTLGFITMGNALQIMKERFETDLDGPEQDCLRSIMLMLRVGVWPIGHARIMSTLEVVFNRYNVVLRDILVSLTEQGFLHSGERDPVTPEMAYLLDPQTGVVTYGSGRSIDRDVKVLTDDCFQRSDIHALALIAFGHAASSRSAQALEMIERFIQQYGRRHEVNVQYATAMVLSAKALALTELQRNEEALATCNEIVRRFGGTTMTPLLQSLVGSALYNKGVVLGVLGRLEEEVGAYDESFQLLRESRDPEVQLHLAITLYNKAVTLGTLKRFDEEISVYDSLVRRYGNTERITIMEVLAKSLFNKSVRLGKLGRNAEQVSVVEDIVFRFGNRRESVFKNLVANALLSKVSVVLSANRTQEAIEVCDDIIKRGEEDMEPLIQELILVALGRKGAALAMLGRHREAIACFDDVPRRASKLASDNAKAQTAISLVAKSRAFVEMGHATDAKASLLSALAVRSQLPKEIDVMLMKMLDELGVDLKNVDA